MPCLLPPLLLLKLVFSAFLLNIWSLFCMSIFVASNCSASPRESWYGLGDLCWGDFKPCSGLSWEAKCLKQGSLEIAVLMNMSGKLHLQVVLLLVVKYQCVALFPTRGDHPKKCVTTVLHTDVLLSGLGWSLWQHQTTLCIGTLPIVQWWLAANVHTTAPFLRAVVLSWVVL